MARSSTNSSDQPDTPQLSEIESEAMDILWTADHALTANEVVAQIFHGRHATKRELPNYTTIASMLTRLVQRGLLKSTKLSPRNIVYSPQMPRAQYAAHAVQQIFQRILKRDLAAVLPGLTGSTATSDDAEVQQFLTEIRGLK